MPLWKIDLKVATSVKDSGILLHFSQLTTAVAAIFILCFHTDLYLPLAKDNTQM